MILPKLLQDYKIKLTEGHFDSAVHKKFHSFAIILDLLCLLLVLGLTLKPAQAVFGPLVSPLSSTSFSLIKTANAETSVTLPSGETVVVANLHALFTDNMQYKSYIVKKASEFMGLAPDSQLRATREIALMKYLSSNDASAADVILALEAVGTKAARAWGMEYIWQMRQRGQLAAYNVYPLSGERIAWAKKHNVDPRMLAIASDVYGPTTHILKAKPELFFEAAKETKGKAEIVHDFVPNPAVVAQLQMSETGWSFGGILRDLREMNIEWPFSKATTEDRGFVNIGGVTAWDALNLSPEWFPSGRSDLMWISKELEDATGLPYVKNVKALPGSFRGSGDGSGGAIGPQFMPLNARLFMTWYKEANASLGNAYPTMSPFNPWTGTMLAYLYISSEFYHRQLDVTNITPVVRPGYELTSAPSYTRQDPRMRALLKWNPLLWEAKAAVKAGDDYFALWSSKDSLTYNKK